MVSDLIEARKNEIEETKKIKTKDKNTGKR